MESPIATGGEAMDTTEDVQLELNRPSSSGLRFFLHPVWVMGALYFDLDSYLTSYILLFFEFYLSNFRFRILLWAILVLQKLFAAD